ncbi:DPP IV N-terminal domain-containing protein [Massilia eburnea]|uniref:DPP IV N-terminal domain-containing protein n=1 Tax=Massilia eburnea TaxID=1776165 RepID=UPI003D6B8016
MPLAGNLYLVDLSKPDSARLVASGSVIDPKISPKGKYVSFVRNQNLFRDRPGHRQGAPTDHRWQRHRA